MVKAFSNREILFYVILISLLGTSFLYWKLERGSVNPYDLLFKKSSRIKGYVVTIAPLINGRLYARVSEGKCPRDRSYYDGKCYYYICPLIGIFLYLPLILLFGIYPSDMLIAIILFFGTSISGCGIIVYISKKFFKDVPKHIVVIGMVVFVCNRGMNFMSNIASANYLIPQFAANFFISSSICMFLYAPKKHQRGLYLLLGIFLGFGMWNRTTLLPSTIIVLISFLWYLRLNHVKTEKKTSSLNLIVGFAMVLAVVLLLNYLRFGDFFETGLQLQNNKFVKGGYSKIDYTNIGTGYWNYLLQPPRFNARKLDIDAFSEVRYCKKVGGTLCDFLVAVAGKQLRIGTASTGLLFIAPYTLPVLLIPFYLIWKTIRLGLAGIWNKKNLPGLIRKPEPKHVFLYSMFLCFLATVTALSLVRIVRERYYYDFIPFAVLASFTGYCFILEKINERHPTNKALVYAFNFVFIALSAITVFFSR
ncbi:MAG: hypothetical protein KKD39_00865 [Candidatus Altiarchaeota archaeon]|nr:hypothetical protein [Candidatus Altiarchaeota archaeon]